MINCSLSNLKLLAFRKKTQYQSTRVRTETACLLCLFPSDNVRCSSFPMVFSTEIQSAGRPRLFKMKDQFNLQFLLDELFVKCTCMLFTVPVTCRHNTNKNENFNDEEQLQSLQNHWTIRHCVFYSKLSPIISNEDLLSYLQGIANQDQRFYSINSL